MVEQRGKDGFRERAHRNTTEARFWLREHYGRLRKRMEVRWPPYAEVAAEMAAAGISGGTRHAPVPLAPRAVERMWKAVCRDVAEERRVRRSAVGETKWKPASIVQRAEPEPTATDGRDYDAWADMDRQSGRR